MITTHLALVPRDALFFKDGRGWFTSETGRGHALEWPYPSTVRGALRAIWGRRREGQGPRSFTSQQWRDHTDAIALRTMLALRRPWSASGSVSAWERVWPVPGDIFISATGEPERLDPLPRDPAIRTLGRIDSHDPADAREQLWTAHLGKRKPGERPRWWSETQLLAWIAGNAPERGDPPRLHRRLQTHVTISATTGAAEDEQLFSHELVETLDRGHEWAIGCQVELPSDEFVDIATLGSDSRLARVERLDAQSFASPPKNALRRAFEHKPRGLRLLVVTPCAFRAGWLPSTFACDEERREFRGLLPGIDAELILRAAFVERPLGVSGWDMALRSAKPTTRLVPPGAVYCFVRGDGQPFTPIEAEKLWLAALGDRADEGFGRVVPGIWNPQS